MPMIVFVRIDSAQRRASCGWYGSWRGLPCPGGREQSVQVIEHVIRPCHGPACCHIAVRAEQADASRGVVARLARTAVRCCDHIYLVVP
jgi:hypothetical protein